VQIELSMPQDFMVQWLSKQVSLLATFVGDSDGRDMSDFDSMQILALKDEDALQDVKVSFG
jgi:hypothetical protein